MQAEIISVGDELLIGQVINTNASFIGERLSEAGIHVTRVTTVGDSARMMLDAFARAWHHHDLVIVTGGLGPTEDDITRHVIAEFFHTELVFSPPAYDDLCRFLARYQRQITPMNRNQALVPASCRVIRNPNGTAPGFHFEENGRHFFVLPGVPIEMRGMIDNDIIPLLAARTGEARCSVTLLATGIPESTLAARIEAVDTSDIALAYLPSQIGVRLRISTFDVTPDAAQSRVGRVRDAVLAEIGEFVFGEGTTTLEAVVGALLTDAHATIAVAESCSGGALADKLTNVPGSSRYLHSGVVAYSNEAKTTLLGVDPDIIARHGAVSPQTACAMAAGARRTAGTTYGISTTGIAGPDGATPEKPVGLVWIGLAAGDDVRAFQCFLGADRLRTKQSAAQTALDLLRRSMLGLPFTNSHVQSIWLHP